MRETHRKIDVACGKMWPHPRKRPPPALFQGGVFAVMIVPLILIIVGFFGFTIALSMIYNRKVELQTVADSVALAAASQLNGTDAGIQKAISAAAEAAATGLYSYNAAGVEWDDAAISFGASAGGNGWTDAVGAGANGAAANLFFVKVDTSRLAARHGDVGTSLLQVLPSAPASFHVTSTAVAGRKSIGILPLAICAMADKRGDSRGAELVEYGFRRGVSYDLMALNPNSNSLGANYLVNPIAAPGSLGTSLMNRLDIVRPFVCTGTLALPSIAAGRITVESSFPLASVYQQLNSRFGSYVDPCTSATAPPDTNVKPYTFSTALPWLSVVPKGQAAQTVATGTKLATIADLPFEEAPSTTTPDLYGPLWLYAKAAKYADYREGVSEPTAGYSTFSTSDWATLYKPGPPSVKPGSTYPSTPYTSNTALPPGGIKGVAERRVLNVPLLRCPVSTSGPVLADVLAIGKFFMTVPATDTSIFAEFAGLRPEPLIAGQVAVFR